LILQTQVIVTVEGLYQWRFCYSGSFFTVEILLQWRLQQTAGTCHWVCHHRLVSSDQRCVEARLGPATAWRPQPNATCRSWVLEG